MDILNPYRDIDFNSVNQYKTSLHSHIRPKDDLELTKGITENLNDLGFDIYARTEKNDIRTMGGVGEYTFDAHEKTSDIIEHAIVLFSEGYGNYSYHNNNDSLMIRAHPNDPTRPTYTYEQIKNQFDRYSNMIGLEVLSRSYSSQSSNGDPLHPFRRGEGQYVRSAKMWDYMLKNVKGRNILGIGATDAYNDHVLALGNVDSVYDVAFNYLLMNSITDDSIKSALKKGEFFFVSHMNKEKDIPKINGISVENDVITVDCENYEVIYWFYNNEVVHKGISYDLSQIEDEQEYIRFEVWTDESDLWEGVENENPRHSNFYSSNFVGSQPFLLGDQTLPPKKKRIQSSYKLLLLECRDMLCSREFLI